MSRTKGFWGLWLGIGLGLSVALTVGEPLFGNLSDQDTLPEGVVCRDGVCLLPPLATETSDNTNQETTSKKTESHDTSNLAAKSSDADSPDADSPAAIDLAQTPWLVESAHSTYPAPGPIREHAIYADSFLWVPIDELMAEIPVERWVTPLPDNLAGKYILIECWASWCPPCRRSMPYLNFIQEKYADDLVVVAVCETDEQAIRSMPGDFDLENVRFSLAIDTGRRFANRLNVIGIPHAVLLEPMLGGVVWEGMPTLPHYELDDVKLEKFFRIGAKLRQEGRLPQESPVHFVVSEASQEERDSRRVPATAKDRLGEPSLESSSDSAIDQH